MRSKQVATPLQVKMLVVASTTFILLLVFLSFSIYAVVITQFTQMEQQIKTVQPDRLSLLLIQERNAMIRYIYLFFLGSTALIVGGQLYFMRFSILQPLQQVVRSINQIDNNGALAQRIASTGDREIRNLIRAINTMLAALEFTQQRSQQYRTVVEKSPAAVILVHSLTRRIIDANSSFHQITGYTKQEISSLTIYTLLVLSALEIDTWLAAIMQNPQERANDLLYLQKSGQTVAVEVNAIFLQGGENSLYCLIARDISVRKQAQQALLDAIPENFVRLRADGTYLEVKQAGDLPLPYSSAEMIGRNIYDLMPRQTADIIMAATQRALASNRIEAFEYERELQGKRLYLDVRLAASGKDETVAMIRNVTKLREAEETIRHQASLVDNVSDAIISTALDMSIISWNRAAQTIYGFTFAEVQGKHFRDVVHYEYSNGAHGQVTAALQEKGAWQGEQIHYTRAGVPIYMWASLAYIYDHKGQPTSVVGVNRDITERKSAERLLLLAQQSESLRIMASGIAHDFNNLLTGVLAQNTLALRKLPAESKAAIHISKAIKATERTADLTRQLLAYTGQGAFLIESVNLNQLIQEHSGLIKTVIPKHTRLELNLTSVLTNINIDRGHAQQVIMNLILNGVEAIQTETGLLQIATGEQTIEQPNATSLLGAEQLVPGRYVSLRVTDNGIGMSAAMQERIFEPYFTTKQGGSGLGLAATIGIVRHYHGGLSVESQEGSGTSFTIFFPLAEQPAQGSNQQQPPATQQGGNLVLIVDDEAAVREALGELLASEGHEVIVAQDGYEGVKKFQQHQQQIALIFLDMKMPGMNGAQTLAALRAIDTAIPVIICSGYSETEATTAVHGLGVAGFLKKPFDVAHVFSIVTEVLMTRTFEHNTIYSLGNKAL